MRFYDCMKVEQQEKWNMDTHTYIQRKREKDNERAREKEVKLRARTVSCVRQSVYWIWLKLIKSMGGPRNVLDNDVICSKPCSTRTAHQAII